MKKIFAPEDFLPFLDNRTIELRANKAATFANAKLAELIESWPVVYCEDDPKELTATDWHTGAQAEYHSFKARLAFIEEIPKEPCKHEPTLLSNYHSDMPPLTVYNCKHCGVELQAEWKEKK